LATCLGQANPSPASHKDTIPTTEREALLALYAATDGDRWKDHEGWLGPPGTECNWYGVACKPGTNLEWRVSDLAVSENDLNGLVPGELGQLTQLKSLWIFGNHVSGKVPQPLIERSLSGLLGIIDATPFVRTRVKRHGRTYEVVAWGGAPFDFWVIQRAIQSTVVDLDWTSTKRQPSCPRWDEGELKKSAEKK